MPFRELVDKELADLLGVLAHGHRLRIIAELRQGEQDVNALQAAIGISHSGVSQHLSLLRAHRLVSERRQGRQVFYRLRHGELASWLMDGMQFLGEEQGLADDRRKVIARIRRTWSSDRTSIARTE